MVGMDMSFGSADFSTPHGGPPFQGWRKGFGFGHAKGPGNATLDPASACQLRYTPTGDRAYASNAFWRRKWETGSACGFGIGDRPDYGKSDKDGSVAPNNYGDVSKVLMNTKRNQTRRGISLKHRYPSIEETKRDLSWPTGGPGPAKYNTSIPIGQSSWSNPAGSPAWSMPPRSMVDPEIVDKMSQPGPTEYTTHHVPGTNSLIKKGTLYNISLKGRNKPTDIAGDISPGPARYNLKGKGGVTAKCGQPLDEYGLWEKIQNVKAPPFRPRAFDGRQDEKATSPNARKLTRVESSPV